MVRTRLKNLLNGAVLEKSFKTSEKFPEPDVQLVSVSFLYSDPDGFHCTGNAVSLQLPQYVELTIASTKPGVRGHTAAGGAKKVPKLETGLEVQVPLFMKEGEIVHVNTKTAEVAGRA